jgi:hypothetical protein
MHASSYAGIFFAEIGSSDCLGRILVKMCFLYDQ